MIICLLIPLGAASASDINTTTAEDQVLSATPSVDTLSASVNTEQENNSINVKNDENLLILGINSDNDILSDEIDTGSYSDLVKLISLSKSSFTLEQDFKYDSSIDSPYKNGIMISKSNFVLDGGGHAIDGSSLAAVFRITGDNVVLKNIIIKNAYVLVDNGVPDSLDVGGIITWSGSYGEINNVTFLKNSVSATKINIKGHVNN